MMNQFAQLLSAENQTAVLLDCCIIINTWKQKPEALQFRKRIASRKDIKIIVPHILIEEVAKVAGITKDQAVALIESFSNAGQIEYIGQCGADEANRIAKEAEGLKAKYPGYCHYPDNHYVVLCKDYDATLVTHDSNLKDVATAERVTACLPEQFWSYHH